jgi:aspartate kinase
MKVLKFGGTSVGSAARMQKLLDIINPQERQIVVLSAMSGTTNNLVEIGHAYLTNDKAKAAACGSIVFSKRTGILYFCAGKTLCGCNILAPK